MLSFFAFKRMVVAEVAKSTWHEVKTHLLLEGLVTFAGVLVGYFAGGISGTIVGGLAAITFIAVAFWLKNCFDQPYRVYLRKEELEQLRKPRIEVERVDVRVVRVLHRSQYEDSKYVQIRVADIGEEPLTCQASLVGVARYDHGKRVWDAGPDESFLLPWAMRDAREMVLRYGVPETINLLSCRIKDAKLAFVTGVSRIYEEFIAVNGTYMFRVAITADRGGPVVLGVKVDNRAGWNSLEISSVGDGEARAATKP